MYCALPFPSRAAAPGELRLQKARDLAALLAGHEVPFVRMVECRASESADGQEIVVFDVDVERGQQTVHDIRRQERIAALFRHGDETYPDVLALRADFPAVPHTNLKPWEKPRSLCLFTEPFDDLKLRWTPLVLIARVREWLALTARGILHGHDQPLEPLLLEFGGELILSHRILDSNSRTKPLPLVVNRLDDGHGTPRLAAQLMEDRGTAPQPVSLVACALTCPTTTHGVINRQPRNMADLASMVNRDGFDLLASLQAHFQTWLKSPHHKSLFEAHLAIILIMPKAREPGGEIQSRETWAYFCLNQKIGSIGENLGAWQKTGREYGLVLAGPPPVNAGQPCVLHALRTTPTMSADAAAVMNGFEKRVTHRVAAIGVGALGSQVVLNLTRAGWGSWTLIDDDITNPHNLARHALAGSSLGHPKAHCVAAMVNSLTDGEPLATSIVADALHPGPHEAAVNAALTGAEVILDASASIAVSRHLALDVQGAARRLSIFLSPSGRDAVLLAEDAGRSFRLDLLEMQYYRHVASEQDLADHLRQPADNRRYANSCRDTSVTMPQDLVALHAATCSRGIKAALSSGDALIAVWKANERDLSVRCLRFPPSPPVVHRFGNWTLITDASLIDKIHAARAKRLPAETGGVLIGYHDMMRKIVYVADTILSPPDSVEWPTVYIRGCRDLPAAVKELSEKSGGNLGYVGEWHSHPDGCSCRPSGLDIKAFAWLTVEMSDGGHPALMAIAGDKGATAFFLGQMAPDHDDLEARTAR